MFAYERSSNPLDPQNPPTYRVYELVNGRQIWLCRSNEEGNAQRIVRLLNLIVEVAQVVRAYADRDLPSEVCLSLIQTLVRTANDPAAAAGSTRAQALPEDPPPDSAPA